MGENAGERGTVGGGNISLCVNANEAIARAALVATVREREIGRQERRR